MVDVRMGEDDGVRVRDFAREIAVPVTRVITLT